MNSDQGLVLLDFYSDTCQPCKRLMSDLDEIIEEFSNLKIEKINIMDNYDLTVKYNIRSVPTLVLLKDEDHTSYIGYKGKDDLRQFLNQNI